MMRRIVVLFCLTLTLAAVGSAQPEGTPPRGRMAEKLNLSVEQRSKLETLTADWQKNMIQMRAKIRSAQIDMRQLMRAEPPDRKAIENQVKTISGLQQQLKLDRVDHLFAVRSVLTPDQLKIWKENRGSGAALQRMRPGARPHRRAGRGLLGENLSETDQMLEGSAPIPFGE